MYEVVNYYPVRHILQESWDYIGSSRMVYDMQRNAFPNSRDSGKTVSDIVHVYMYKTFTCTCTCTQTP